MQDDSLEEAAVAAARCTADAVTQDRRKPGADSSDNDEKFFFSCYLRSKKR